jgi:hypothetical protein
MAVSDVWLRDGMLAEAEDQAKRALELCRNHPWSESTYAQERLANLQYITQQIQLASARHHEPPLAPIVATINTHTTSTTGIAAPQRHQRVLGVFAPQPSLPMPLQPSLPAPLQPLSPAPLQTPAFGSGWPSGAVVSVMGYYSPSSSPSAPRPSQQPTIARSPVHASPPPRGPLPQMMIAASPGTPYHGTTTVVTTHATTITFVGHHQQPSGPQSSEPDEYAELLAILDANDPPCPYL